MTHAPDRRAIVLPEISDRFVIGSQPPDQPYHLDIAARLVFKAPLDCTRL
jgi:hypothetical protein